MKVRISSSSHRLTRNQGSKTLRKAYDKIAKKIAMHRDSYVFSMDMLKVKFVRECFMTYLNHVEGTDFTYDMDEATVISKCQQLKDNGCDLSSRYKEMALGVKLDANICFKNDSIWLRDENKSYSISEFFQGDFYRALYTWVSALMMGLSSCNYFGKFVVSKMIKSIIDNCDITVKDFIDMDMDMADSDGIFGEAFTFAATLYEKVPVDVPLFGSLSVLHGVGAHNKGVFGLILIALYFGRIKGLLKTMYEYSLYLPASISTLRGIFLDAPYLSKRKEVYNAYNIFDTSLYAVTKGVSGLDKFYTTLFPDNKMFNSEYSIFCKSLSKEMYSYIEDTFNKIDTTDSQQLEDKVSMMHGTDPFCSWEYTGNKMYGSLRYLFDWQYSIKSEYSDEVRVITLSTALLDAYLSTSVSRAGTTSLFSRIDTTKFKDAEIDLMRSNFPSDDVSSLRMNIISSFDNILSAYALVVPLTQISDYQSEVSKYSHKVSSLESDLERAKNKNNLLSEDKRKLKEEISAVKKASEEKVSKETESLKNKIAELTEYISSVESMLEVTSNKLMEKTKECSKLAKANKKLQAQPTAEDKEGVSQEEETVVETTFEEKVEFLQQFHFIIAAGEPNFDRRLQAVGLTNFTWFNEFKDKRNKVKFDYIVICTHNCPHRLVYWAQCLDRANSKTVYFNSTGAKAFVEQMYNELT